MHHHTKTQAQAHAQQVSGDLHSRIIHELSRITKRRPAQDKFSSCSSSRRHASTRGYTTNRSIRVTNDFGDKKALLLLLDQHGRHLIEKMAFCIRPRALEPDEALDADKSHLSPAARELLSGRLTGPNLRRIDIECGLDVGQAGTGSSSGSDTVKFAREVERAFRHARDEEALLQLEADEPRRRLLADTWAALAQNTTVRELAVDRLVPAWTSSFHSAGFRDLLRRLESLRVGIFGAKSGHRSTNTVPAYVDSLQSILKVLFLHASELRRLSLHASQHAPLGARGHYHIPLSLKATQLPRLQHLSLKNCFVGFELAHFINAHAGTLETLELHNCYAYRGAGDAGAGGMAWAPFLAMITRPGAMRLRRLVIRDDYIPLDIHDERLRSYDPETADEPEDVRNVRRAQRTRPALRLFLYALLRDYSGELWMNKEAILASFDAEDDQRAYEALMRVVRANADAPVGGGRDTSSEKTSVVETVELVELPT